MGLFTPKLCPFCGSPLERGLFAEPHFVKFGLYYSFDCCKKCEKHYNDYPAEERFRIAAKICNLSNFYKKINDKTKVALVKKYEEGFIETLGERFPSKPTERGSFYTYNEYGVFWVNEWPLTVFDNHLVKEMNDNLLGINCFSPGFASEDIEGIEYCLKFPDLSMELAMPPDTVPVIVKLNNPKKMNYKPCITVITISTDDVSFRKIKKTVKEETVKLLEQFAHDIHYEGPIKEISSII